MESLSLVNQVELELSVAGRVECSQQAVLFVPKNNSVCHWKHACTGQDLVTTINNVTLCLVSVCPNYYILGGFEINN